MPVHAHLSRLACLGASLCLFACRGPEPSAAPATQQRPAPAPALSTDDEALLASLLAEDPGDFHVARTRIWRLGPARWTASGPELPHRPSADPRAGALHRPLEAVVIDRAGPRVLLPFDALVGAPKQSESWSALSIVAVLSASDLVAGLTRELRPTPWLSVSAGVGLSPLGREDDHLRVRWSDPACGFALELALDDEDFGSLYEPGPAGPPGDTPEARGAVARRLAPGTEIFVDANASEPVLRLDPDSASHGERMSAAQRVTLDGAPKRGRQPITLRCRGVEVSGWVATGNIVESSARYAMVEDTTPHSSSCADVSADPITVARATPLYEPTGTQDAALIGVVGADVDIAASPGVDGWWRGCVASPWGDLVFQFRLR